MSSFDAKLKHLEGLLAKAGVKHFFAHEFMQPKRGTPDDSLLWRIVPTAVVLDAARARLGPIHITNGYRSPEYNKQIGGQKNSLHIEMNAADASPVDASAGDLFRFLSKHPMAPCMGLGRYSNFVHLDTRGVLGRKIPARWDNRR